MSERTEYLPEETKQEATPHQNTAITTTETATPETGFSFIRSMAELWMSRLTDTDEELAKERSIIEELLLSVTGLEIRRLQEKLKPIKMEQRFRKDPEAARVFEQWKEVQYRRFDEYTAWEKATREKYGDEELGRRILAGEAPECEYNPGEEELWYKYMHIKVEEGVIPESALRYVPESMEKFVKAVEDAGGFSNWELLRQDQFRKELGFPEPIKPDDSGSSTTNKIADIQQELKTLSSLE
jgi:hypothetical protein